MPTDEENLQFLYLVLTHGGPPKINWAPICTEFSLNQGAASKRWSRLKADVEAGKSAGWKSDQATKTLTFLWVLVKQGCKAKAPDWQSIANTCGTTPGAASKRFSRLRLIFEKGGPAQTDHIASTPPTPPKKPAPITAKGLATPAPTPKRKRAPGTTKTSGIAPEHSEDGADAYVTPKRARAGKKNASPDDKFKPEVFSDEDEDEYMPTKRHRTAPGRKPRAPAVRAPVPMPVESADAAVPVKPEPVKFEFENEYEFGGGDVFYEVSEYPEEDAQERVDEWLEGSVV